MFYVFYVNNSVDYIADNYSSDSDDRNGDSDK